MLCQAHRYYAKCNPRVDEGSKWQPDNRASGGGCGYACATVKSFDDWVVNTFDPNIADHIDKTKAVNLADLMN